MHDERGPIAPSDEGHERNGCERLARRVVAPTPARVRGLSGLVALLMATGSLAALSIGSATPAAGSPGFLASGADPVAHLRIRVVDTQVLGAGVEADPGPAPSVAPAPPAAPLPPASTAAPNLLPTGKGMWFHTLEQAGPIDGIIARATATGISHLYVRVGSSRMGFYAQPDLDRLLPAAHGAGLRVIGWDFPYLEDLNADIGRAVDQIKYTTPDGHRIDGFSADIETGREGVALATDRVEYYTRNVRYYAGPGYPLVGTVPNACLNDTFPYAEVATHFDALAPMVYWITRDPTADVTCNMERLAPLGRPVLPVGQAYDPAIDNPALINLVPGYEHLEAFMLAAARLGAPGVSFWAWHTATDDMWRAVADSPHFTLVPMATGHADPAQVAVLQRLLNGYGYAVGVDAKYGSATVGALAQLQDDLGLPPTGQLDAATIARLSGRR